MLTIGEVAARAGVNASQIRYYEEVSPADVKLRVI
jgi:DNA-binding transcriptional MerR regulator